MMWFLLALGAANFAIGYAHIDTIGVINFAACAACAFAAGRN